ncbi:hypothetical protein AVDCRST_MAG84-840 [uncultured Microcoleus sp.]|uniref:Uncharacterized protein n=1 Tax=uncultured Microcoleus sp. TaxID=259945 RepID=A0A6J4KQU0_9CYAN|nr:hypothetical protein AVDCRST_MAG84-840 [uncultured Microcoleus sp.]
MRFVGCGTNAAVKTDCCLGGASESCKRISRLVSQTLSFSKKLEIHKGAIWNFIHDYNHQIRLGMLKVQLPQFSPSFT